MAYVSVDQLMSFVRSIEQQKGKYIKLVLSQLESQKNLNPAVRKTVLDGMNGFARAIYREIGYNLED